MSKYSKNRKVQKPTNRLADEQEKAAAAKRKREIVEEKFEYDLRDITGGYYVGFGS